MAAWERGDLRAMHGLLSPSAQTSYPLARFRRAYAPGGGHRDALLARRGRPGGRRGRPGRGAAGRPHARVRQASAATSACRSRTTASSGSRGSCSRSCAPASGSRRNSLPPVRATLRSRDRKVLAEGPATSRTSPLVGIADSIAGPHGAAGDAGRARGAVRARLPARLAGRAERARAGLREAPARAARRGAHRGQRACSRGHGRARPRAVVTTIDTRLQEAAVIGLAGRLGGVAALDPRNGEVRALAGIAFSAPQPPGSTFKIVTATAALELGAREAVHRVPGRDARRHRRRGARERQRRVLRRHVPQLVRALVQLGVRPARREDPGRGAGGRRGALRMERARDDPGRGGEHAPARRGDRHPARGGLHRDRPVRDAGHAASDGLGRSDDRDARACATRPRSSPGGGHVARG